MKTFVQVFPNKEIKNLLKPKSAYEYILLFYFPVTRHALVLPISVLITFSLEVKGGLFMVLKDAIWQIQRKSSLLHLIIAN